MYELPQSLLVANPINSYLLNSPMHPQCVKGADDGLTFYVQNKSPGKEKEPLMARDQREPCGPPFMLVP